METNVLNIKKYPKSKNKKQCLGPCYKPGTTIVHPTYLEYVTDEINPFCPVEEWRQTDIVTGRTTGVITDTCFNPIDEQSTSKELEMNILTPYIDFNLDQFLKIYYEIFSFEHSIDWIDRNKHAPLNTKIRIINAALTTYGNKIEIFDSRFTDFFIEIIKRNEIANIYDKIHKNIGIDDASNIYFVNASKNDLSSKQKYVERTNYLIKIFLDKDEVTKFLSKYFRRKKQIWADIYNYIIDMINDFVNMIITKMQMLH